jgi:hypothetical protein
MRIKLNFFYRAIKRWHVAVQNYRLIFSLADYWNELAKLDWWLLMADEALAMPERVSDEHNKLLTLMDIAELSKHHEMLLDGFIAFGMLGHPQPLRPKSRTT